MDFFDAVSFSACRQRLDWAERKAYALVSEWQELYRKHPYSITLDPKGNRKYAVILEGGTPAIPVEFSLILGEILYHIRAALDGSIYVCSAEKNIPPESEKRPRFLFCAKKSDFEDRIKLMHGINKGRQAIIRAAQPYYTPTNPSEAAIAQYRPALWMIEELAIVDRHRRIHPVTTIIRSVDFQIIPPEPYVIEFERLIDPIQTGLKNNIGEIILSGPESTTPVQVQFKGEITGQISIDGAASEFLKGHMLFDRIHTAIEATRAVIEALEKAKE